MPDNQENQKCHICNKTQSELGTALLLCGRCKNARYCSKTCQSAGWPTHKKRCTPAVPTPSAPPSTQGRKRVLLLNFEDSSWLGDMYDNFHAEMSAECDYKTVTKSTAAVDEIARNPNVVILFEPSLMNKRKQVKFQAINHSLVAYAKAGGTVIFTCQCSGQVTPPNSDWYFESVWGLRWKFGNYARFDFVLKIPTIYGKQLPREYCVKAVQLDGVEAGSVVYRQAGESHSLAGLPTPPDMGSGSGPVIWQRVGAGWLGWTGDVNNEKETREIVRMMAGF